jgi:hypothetical protein
LGSWRETVFGGRFLHRAAVRTGGMIWDCFRLFNLKFRLTERG